MNTSIKELPLPGEVFAVEGCRAFLISPTTKSSNMPWVWYAPTLPGYPAAEEKWMFERFLNAGVAVAGIDVGESYGSPAGTKLFSALHHELTTKRGLSKKASLLPRSRGGLMLYNWAIENPDKVACIAGIYTVCDISSYPGIKQACSAYEMIEEELTAKLAEHNPVGRIAPLARTKVPIFHIHGNCDELVPLEKNTGPVAKQYRQLGGPITLRVIKGQGHNMWSGWFECQELVDFIVAHAR